MHGGSLEITLTVPLMKVRPVIPTQKEVEPLLEMDRDEKKLDAFLSFHRKTLTVANLKIFLPFTINLDPFIKKVIKDEVQNLEELGLNILSSPQSAPTSQHPLNPKLTSNTPLTRRQVVGLSKKMNPQDTINYPSNRVPQFGGMNPMNPPYPWQQYQPYPTQQYYPYMQPRPVNLPSIVLPHELQGLLLSNMSVEQVCTLLKTIEYINPSMLETYCGTIVYNNINGRVLMNCEVDELKNVINMSFGDWELFKITLTSLREDEMNGGPRPSSPGLDLTQRLPEDKLEDRLSRMDSGIRRKQTAMERQVALEQATVSGLLSTLNEDAQEDILLEEINQAREEAGNTFSDRTSEADEADVLYYSNPSRRASIQINLDTLSDPGMQMHDLEKVKKVITHLELCIYF